MKVRITKLKGGKKLPDGFWIRGEGQKPEPTYNVMMAPVDEMSHKLPTAIPDAAWFITDTVVNVYETTNGFLFTTRDSLWAWHEVYKENDGTWRIG
jgi:hypothetical protein